MAGKILTPVSVWSGFNIDFIPQAESVEDYKDGEYAVSKFYLGGRRYKDAQTKVFCTSITKNKEPKEAVFVIPDLEKGTDEGLLKALADKGWYVVSIDLAGIKDGEKNYTVYPESLSYANYAVAKDSLTAVGEDVFSTCWYEWACEVKHVLEYLEKNAAYKKIGGIGVGKAATTLWHVLSNETRMSFAVSILNAGWETYAKFGKFEGESPSDFTDEQVKYLAGIEAQAYAPYVKCPVMVLSATNSGVFDCDRVIDTVSRVKENYYSAADYSVNYSDAVDKDGFDNLLRFAAVCFEENGVSTLPEYPDLVCETEDKVLRLKVKAEAKNLKKVSVFASEQILTKDRRSWVKCAEAFYNDGESGEFCFDYFPYEETGLVLFFAKAEYESGFTVSSYIVCKRIEKDEVCVKYKTGILCSTREAFAESVFAPAKTDDLISCVDVDGEREVKYENGPMNIKGVYSPAGLITYKINSKKDKPNDDAILIMDVYVQKDGYFTATLMAESADGSITEYSYSVNLVGGDLWHNLKIELQRFKSAEGRLLKSYENVFAVKFYAEGKYLINNALFL